MKTVLYCIVSIVLLFALPYNVYAQEINRIGEEQLRERLKSIQNKQRSGGNEDEMPEGRSDVPPIAVSVVRIANVVGDIICFSFAQKERREFCLDDGTEGIYGTLRQAVDIFSIVFRRGDEILKAVIYPTHGYPGNVLKVYNDSYGALQIEGPVR
jgi:hypothetical protein